MNPAALHSIVIVSSAIGFVLFGVCAWLIGTTKPAEAPVLAISTKRTLLTGMILYTYVTAAYLVVELGLIPGVKYYVGYLEITFPVLVFAALSAARNTQAMNDLERSHRALASSSEFLYGIVDIAPAGIVFVDDVGHVTFANQTAREVLDLEDDPNTLWMSAPWTGYRPDGLEMTNQGLAAMEEPVDNMPVRMVWPGGWQVKLRVSIEPLRDATGKIGGHVLTFERPPRGIGGREF